MPLGRECRANAIRWHERCFVPPHANAVRAAGAGNSLQFAKMIEETASRPLQNANSRLGRVAKWSMVLAVPLVFAVAWLDLRREERRALSDFTDEQRRLAESLAAILKTGAPAEHLLQGMSLEQDPLARCLVLDGARFTAPGATTSAGDANDERLEPEVRELLQRMGRGESGAMTLHRAAAASLGLDPRLAVAAFAPAHARSVAVVASAMRFRDRATAGVWRLAAATGFVGALVGLFGLLVTRQQRRSMELVQALQISEATAALRERSEKIVENIPIGVCALDAGNRVTSVNPYLAARGWASIIPVEILALVEEARVVRQTVERVGLQLRLGDLRDLDVQAVPLERPLPDADCILVLHDRTEVRVLERNLARAEKLATIGTLAAGVAHEVGTPMGIISGRAEQALARAADEPTKKALSSILAQVDKVSTTIRQLLDFARVRPVEAGAVAPATLLEQCRGLLEHRFRQAKVSIAIDAPPLLPSLRGDPGQLEQVFVNLLMNAVDACSAGGMVTARVSEHGERLRFEIRDDGCGISPENLKQVLDPFFTTKKRGQGTGLGLTIAADIVKNHGGTLDLQSAPRRGTTVSIELPRFDGAHR
jgi:signal transduction histidine kinase